MRVGFTGTQEGMTSLQRQFVYDEVMAMLPAEAHHGCCIGADYEFDRLLGATWVKAVVGHPPSNTVKMASDCHCDAFRDPLPYLARNRNIVDETDWLIAAPKGPEVQRSGTWSTVRYARRLGRPVTIVWPDGNVTRERVPPPPHQ